MCQLISLRDCAQSWMSKKEGNIWLRGEGFDRHWFYVNDLVFDWLVEWLSVDCLIDIMTNMHHYSYLSDFTWTDQCVPRSWTVSFLSGEGVGSGTSWSNISLFFRHSTLCTIPKTKLPQLYFLTFFFKLTSLSNSWWRAEVSVPMLASRNPELFMGISSSSIDSTEVLRPHPLPK